MHPFIDRDSAMHGPSTLAQHCKPAGPLGKAGREDISECGKLLVLKVKIIRPIIPIASMRILVTRYPAYTMTCRVLHGDHQGFVMEAQ